LTGLTAWELRSYRHLDREELIAVIRCERPFEKEADFTLIYTPAGSAHQAARSFQMKGEEWVFGGEILRWRRWLQMLGAKTLYRPLWIEGVSEQRKERLSFHLLQEGHGFLWFCLQKAVGSLPVVETSHGSSVSSRAEYGVQFHLYTTPTGFSIKKITTLFRDVS
jgi:hypothetical protein